ncbi:MAG: Gfo/Idh/MocA family oxidoreductase [Pirellulales bacterium]|nr:Gfo/Idh/MocA family oxidoreductase [Pirellulales bacterium]
MTLGSDRLSRRRFVQQAAVATGLAATRGATAKVLGSNDRIRLGVIGVGNRGDQLLDAFLPHKDAQVVALCDVYEPYLLAAQQKVGGKPALYRDYRKLLDQQDIDAVIIATPDHWHALQCVEACRAGKDVYVEKPLSLTIAEGREMVRVAKETSRVSQVGLHRRSSRVIREAVERIQKGEIGRVTTVHSFHFTNETPMGIGNPPDCDPPADLDWDLWLGPAPKVPYNPNRCLYKFRWFRDYSGGQLTNQGTHYLDVVQWALQQDAPKSVFAIGGKYAVNDNREIPDTLEVVWQYDGPSLVTFSQHNANATRGVRRNWELAFHGTEGTLGFGNNGYELIPESVRTKSLPALSPIDRAGNHADGRAVREAGKSLEVPGSSSTKDHARNFLDCIKSRAATNCPLEVGHRSSTATLLANIALEVGRPIHWNAETERIDGDHQANSLLARAYREPWKQVGPKEVTG